MAEFLRIKFCPSVLSMIIGHKHQHINSMNERMAREFPGLKTFFHVARNDVVLRLYGNTSYTSEEDENELRRCIYRYLIGKLQSFEKITLAPSITDGPVPTDERLDWSETCKFTGFDRKRRHSDTNSTSSTEEWDTPSHSTDSFKMKLWDEIIDCGKTMKPQNLQLLVLKESMYDSTLKDLLQKGNSVDAANIAREAAIVEHKRQLGLFLIDCRAILN
jgi:hypothetical protein